jgi:hypothetical protein
MRLGGQLMRLRGSCCAIDLALFLALLAQLASLSFGNNQRIDRHIACQVSAKSDLLPRVASKLALLAS